MSGFVSFVGSGPGDPELLTVKSVDRLRRADVILFDDLSSGPILSHAASSCELVAVGKRAGRPSPKQHHVSRYWWITRKQVRRLCAKIGRQRIVWPFGRRTRCAARSGH